MKFIDHPANLLLFFFLRKDETCSHILCHGHVRKKGKILKKISDSPFLRLQVDLFFRIKKGPAIEDDLSFIRPQDPGDAFERHTFSAA